METVKIDNLKLKKDFNKKDKILSKIMELSEDLYKVIYYSNGGTIHNSLIDYYKNLLPKEVFLSIINESYYDVKTKHRKNQFKDLTIDSQFVSEDIWKDVNESEIYKMRISNSLLQSLNIQKNNRPYFIEIKVRKINESKALKKFAIFKTEKMQYKVKMYHEEQEGKKMNFIGALSIDLGVHNFAACLNIQTGESFIITGKPLKEERHKAKHTLQNYFSEKFSSNIEIDDKKKNETLSEKNNKSDYYIKVTAKYLVEYCLKNQLGTIVVGKNKEIIKNGKHKKPKRIYLYQHQMFINQLFIVCKRNGINLRIVNEYGTSKTDFLAMETFPAIGEKKQYLGKRVERGLFQSSTGKTLNADINAAGNIARKARFKIDIKKIEGNICKNPTIINPIDFEKEKNLNLQLGFFLKELMMMGS